MLFSSTRRLLSRFFAVHRPLTASVPCVALHQRLSHGLTVTKEAPTTTQLKKDEEEQMPYLENVRDFLEPKEFYDVLSKNGIQFYSGVPDSLLKVCASIRVETPQGGGVRTIVREP